MSRREKDGTWKKKQRTAKEKWRPPWKFDIESKEEWVDCF